MLSVRPALINQSTILAGVKGAYNAIWVKGQYGSDTFYYGRGAGSSPTGVAVVSDMMRVAREITCGSPERVSPFAHERLGEYEPRPDRAAAQADVFLRFRVDDRPGIIAALAGILASKQIGLEAVLQLPGDTKHDLPFVITVESTAEQDIQDAVAQIKAGSISFASRRWRCRWNHLSERPAVLATGSRTSRFAADPSSGQASDNRLGAKRLTADDVQRIAQESRMSLRLPHLTWREWLAHAGAAPLAAKTTALRIAFPGRYVLEQDYGERKPKTNRPC